MTKSSALKNASAAKAAKSSTKSANSAKQSYSMAVRKAEYLPLNKAIKALNISLQFEGSTKWNIDLAKELAHVGHTKFAMDCLCFAPNSNLDELVIGYADCTANNDDCYFIAGISDASVQPWTGLKTRKAVMIDGKPCFKVSDLVRSFQVRYRHAIDAGVRRAMGHDSVSASALSAKAEKSYIEMKARIARRAIENPVWGGQTEADLAAMAARKNKSRSAQRKAVIEAACAAAKAAKKATNDFAAKAAQREAKTANRKRNRKSA